MDPTTLTPDNLSEFAKVALDAVHSHNYLLLAALAVTAIVWAVKKFGKPPFFQTAKGSIVLVIATSLGGAFLNAVLAGAPFTWKLALDALAIAFTACGGYRALRVLLGYADAEAIKADAKAAGEAAAAKVAPLKLAEIIRFDVDANGSPVDPEKK